MQWLRNTFCRLINQGKRRALARHWLPLLLADRELVASRQQQRLQRLLVHASKHVPYYRNHLNSPDNTDALSGLPVLTKDVIRLQGERMLSEIFPSQALLEKSTGGSTGEPLVFYRHREYLQASQMGTYRNMTLCGWRPGDPVANFWGINDPTGFRKRALKEQLGMGFYTFNAFDAGPRFFGDWISRLEKIQPVAFYGYASTIWMFCKWMKDSETSHVPRLTSHVPRPAWASRLKGVFLTAERLHGFQRELIEEVLVVPVFNLYGSTEIQNIAFECSKGNMHVASDFVFLEVDAPKGEVGDFILTSLHNYAMPFIRYRNGDRGKWLGYCCDCGIQMPCISLDISRSCDHFRTRSGRVIHGEFFTHVMEGIRGIEKFQFRQTSLDKVELSVVKGNHGKHGKGEGDVDVQVGRVPGFIRENTSGELSVEVMWVDEIPPTSRGKHLFTISDVSHLTFDIPQKTMRTLHIVRALDVGGLERVVLDLVEEGRTHGIESHVACLHCAGKWGEGRDDLTVLTGRTTFGKSLQAARLARALKVDVLHSHNPEPHGVAVLASLLTGIPVVHTKHGRNYPKNKRRVWLNRQQARFSRSIVAVSTDAADVASKIEQIPSGKIHVIHNGIDIERYRPFPRDKSEGVFTIGSVGRLSAEKNYAMLVDVLRILNRAGAGKVRLLIVGDGDERSRLEAQAAGMPVHFAGMQADTAAWLSQMDVFCLTSHTEGMSLTLLEAGAMGLPSVVTDVGGNREVVNNGVTGFVVTAGDTETFVKRLQSLAEDKELRSRMGQSARERVTNLYSVRQMSATYMKIYEDVLGRG